MAFGGKYSCLPLAVWRLRLTDPTGRAHAAVWFKANAHPFLGDPFMWASGHLQNPLGRMCEASNLAHTFQPMTDAQIVDLRDMVLALAEVLHG